MSVALSNNFVKTDEPGGAHRNRVVALGGGHGLSATGGFAYGFSCAL